MKVVFFVHALASCWNNGNAHFLRGVLRSLQRKGHQAIACEPRQAWSRNNLVADHGETPLVDFERAFPGLKPQLYDEGAPDLHALTDGADLVVVHEWNDPEVVNRLGRMRANGAPFVLLFHDTHHRAATRPEEMRRFDFSGYDGVLAFGAVIGELYRSRGWADRVWSWHEAADTSLFYPREARERSGDLVWVGNWGDGERSDEIREFLLDPAESLGLSTDIYGVRYPPEAVEELRRRGIGYRGWLANHRVPETFARYRLTVHVPRRPYVEALPGIPTIRIFEALACGIPLISAPWTDLENLFPPGCFLVAGDGETMRRQMRAVLNEPGLARELVRNGLAAVRASHTCDHRVDQLLAIHASLTAGSAQPIRKAV